MVSPERTVEDAEVVASSRRPGTSAIALIVALGFLAGAIGYLVGVRSSETPTSAVDIGFLVDMSEHHDQAVRMALMELAHGQDPTVRGFAQDVLLFQRSELGAMGVLLDEQGAVRPDLDPDRSAMAWMDMATPSGAMPGMATEEQLARLDAARGLDADRLFLELMSAHHEGGLHMAEYAADHGSDPRVRALAARMAKYQEIEVREYKVQSERLGAGTTGHSADGSMSAMPGMDH
jgi:uncharacterized protein (DUF305 family)